MTSDESLARIKGFVFDLDGTIWEGPTLLPGAAELVTAIRGAGHEVVFASNCSRHGGDVLRDRLVSMGITAESRDVVTAFDLVGDEIRRRLGPVPVLVIGTDELVTVLREAGCRPVGEDQASEALAVIVGVDPSFSYPRLRAAARAVAGGAAFFAINLDARFPVGPDLFEPGCGALAAAIATASGSDPIAFGKPEHPLFRVALERIGRSPDVVAMVGDSTASDMAGGRAAGMFTIWIDQNPSQPKPPTVDLVVRDPAELLRLWNKLAHEAGAGPGSVPTSQTRL